MGATPSDRRCQIPTEETVPLRVVELYKGNKFFTVRVVTQVAQRSCGDPILGSIEIRIGQGVDWEVSLPMAGELE